MSTAKRLAVLLERVSGIVVQERELPRLADLVERRARVHGFRDGVSYLAALRRDPESPEWREILSHVTVNESSFFRGAGQFECFVDRILPELLDTGRETLRFWSAGCARGEETATLAIVLSEAPGLGSGRWSLVGTDVDEGSLEIARRGLYSKRSVRKVPPDLLHRYFKPAGDSYELVAPLRRRIRYTFLNLVNTPYEEFDPDIRFDVIFLRNVLIYFRRESQKRVLEEMARRLAPGGFLFVGPSESLWQVSSEFGAEDCGGCFVHRVRQTAPGAVISSTSSVSAGRPGESRGAERPLHRNVNRPGGETEPREERFGVGAGEHRPSALSKDDAEDPLLHLRVGLTAEAEGRREEALKAFRAAAYLEPRLYQVRYLLASSLEAAGWVRRARSEYRAVATMLAAGEGLDLPAAEFPEVPHRAEVDRLCHLALQTPANQK